MSRYRIEYERGAQRDLRAIRDRTLKLRLLAALEGLMDDPRPPGVKLLVGKEGQWRVRVGDWRIVYRIDDGVLVVEVIKVMPRREVYR
jgi:mRNA interferase RelE/StbE